MKPTDIEAAVAMTATEFSYAIDVAPMFPNFPKTGCYWIGFQWQPGIGRWMAHDGRQNRFRLVAPRVLKSLISEARRKDLVAASYHQPKTETRPES